MSLLAKEIYNIDNFQKLCKVFLYEYYYSDLTDNMQVAFCILINTKDILKQDNHEVILCASGEKGFFEEIKEQMLLGTNKIEIILNILKNKHSHYFKIFLFCLKKLPSCSELVDKIEHKIAKL